MPDYHRHRPNALIVRARFVEPGRATIPGPDCLDLPGNYAFLIKTRATREETWGRDSSRAAGVLCSIQILASERAGQCQAALTFLSFNSRTPLLYEDSMPSVSAGQGSRTSA